MQKKHFIPLFITTFVFLVGIFIYGKTNVYADQSMIDPSYYEYSITSTVGTWYDPHSGCFLFQTLDKKRTSGNYYRTLLVELSRIKDGVNPTDAIYRTDKEAVVIGNDPHFYEVNTSGNDNGKVVDGKLYEREYVAFDRLGLPVETRLVTLDGLVHEYNTFVLDKEVMFRAIAQKYPKWHEEITRKQNANIPIWFGVDSVMLAHYPERANPPRPIQVDKNGTMVDGWMGEVWVSNYTTKSHGEYYRWTNWEDMRAHFPNNIGSFATGSGIYTHFNTYVCLSAAVIPPQGGEVVSGVKDEIVSSEVIVKTYGDANTSSGTAYGGSFDAYSAPHCYTYNTSNEFNLGDAIPSSESYINGVNVSNWYGSVKIDKHRVTYTLNIPYTLVTAIPGTKIMYIQIPTTEIMSPGLHDGLYYPESYDSFDGTYYYYTCSYEAEDNTIAYYCNTYPFTVSAEYYAISNINLYQHKNTIVSNLFSRVSYNGTTIPYYAAINGAAVSTGGYFNDVSFASNTGYHVQVPAALHAEPVNIRIPQTIYTEAEAFAYIGQVINQKYGSANLIVKNDELNLNGVSYLTANSKNFVSNGAYYIGSAANDSLTQTRTITIPEETQNGKYKTYLQSNYVRMVAGSSSNAFRLDGIQCILPGYTRNEPINVHTPVISPISIRGEDKTQLVRSALSTEETQLILDNTYTLKFDWNDYFHKKGYTQPNFPDYVKTKEVRFPFDVIVNGVSYPTYESIGYTDWIDVGNVESFQFYVPSWAEENVYGSNSYGGGVARRIQARVYAINYIEDEVSKWQQIANTDRNQNNEAVNYMATYDYPVQVSGVMYDFKVVSVNDKYLYSDDSSHGVYNFVHNLCEKTTGVLNRFGLPNIRYTLNGEINSEWNTDNVLPTGTNNTPLLHNGHTFGFTLKTIANLNGKNDSIEITPKYRYVGKDGTTKEVSVYFEDAEGKIKSIYDDTYFWETYIGSEYHKGCMYDYFNYDPVAFTAAYKNTNENDILFRKSETHSFGKIILPSELSLLTGNEEQLRANQSKSAEESLRYNTNGGLGSIADAEYEDFEASMQTWYGRYTIPNNVYVCEKTENGSDKFMDVMKEEGACTLDSDIWLKDGYLILNFEITSKNEGLNHLSYYGAASNMWAKENGETEDKTEIKYINPSIQDVETLEIPLKDGDVAIIDLSRRYSDRYSPGILYLN